jgi:hypothetical protein
MLPSILAQADHSGAGKSGGLYVRFIGLFMYFLPFVFALMRGHKHATAIFELNLLLGWSGIG